MGTEDTVFLTSVLFFGTVLMAKAVNDLTYFEIDAKYNDAICLDESNFYGPIVSDTFCAYRCSHTEGCNGFFYNTVTGACSTVKQIPETANECETQNDSVFYKSKKTEPACNNYLVSGPSGVNDSQLTQSAYKCQVERDRCRPDDPVTATSAIYARLNSKGYHTGAWTAPFSTTPVEYVQVDILHGKTISAVVIQGRYHDNYDFEAEYVTSFKVRISLDCEQFTVISDTNGYEKIFDGTTSANAIVIRSLPERVVARCVRIYPATYTGLRKSLRFDVLGCSA